MTRLSPEDTLIPVWSPPRSLRAVRHALANALLPLVVGVDLLSGEDPGTVSLLSTSVAALQRQVSLLDIVTSQVSHPLAPLDLPSDPPGSVALDVVAPAPVAQILHEIPGPWTVSLVDGAAVVASASHPVYADLARTPSPGEPFAVADLGLGVCALAHVLGTRDVPLHVSPDGVVYFALPVSSLPVS